MRDPYEVLGVSRTASQADIKKAYRKLAKELHPDRNPGNARIAERFKEVSAAYQIVGDEKERARYDRGEIDAAGNERARGFHQARGRAGAGAGADIFEQFGFGGGAPEDIFADLFGGMRRGARASRRRGSDRRYSLTVDFMAAAQGARRRITLPEGKTLDVNIPAGIVDGQQIRLKHQGEPGVGGGGAGDVLIEVRVEPHAFFTRKSDDIHLELPVTLAEAVLGARITVPTIDGMVALTVPKGANTGTQLRLKGRGIKNAKSGTRGDQYVKLKVVLPDRPDAALERFVESWAREHDYEVRAKYRV